MKADHEQVCRLVKTARGQLDGVLRMVEEDRYCIDVANQLTAALGRRVRLVDGKKTGRIEIEFYGADDREALIALLQSAGENK